MIVEPDFLDHWKTRLLIELTENPAAPLMVLRLWAHCQQRKKWKFDGLEYSHLRCICHTDMDGSELERALIESKFVEKNGEVLVIHDWDKSNRMLISAWKNGAKGGRPTLTGRKPTGNQSHNRQLTRPSNLSYLSSLSDPVQKRFKDWIEVRRGIGKAPKDWDKMFSEQVLWLGQFQPAEQIEILSSSIRNNYQGLFESKGRNGSIQNQPKEGEEFTEGGQRYSWSKSGGKMVKMKVV